MEGMGGTGGWGGWGGVAGGGEEPRGARRIARRSIRERRRGVHGRDLLGK